MTEAFAPSPALVMTPEQVAEELQVSYHTVVRMCRDGQLPAVKVGGQWRIPRHQLLSYIEGRS